MNKEEEILLINIIKDTISGEEHLGNKLKEKCIDYVENLQQRIDKVNQIIDELLLMGTNEYEIEEQLEELKRVLGEKE